MFKKLIVLISILFSFYSYCQTDIKIILEAGSDNVSVKINWDINALITPITLNIHMMDNTSSVYSLVKSIQNPTNNSSTTIDLQLADDTFFITADFTDNYGNSYYSDTLSPIYIILGGGGITQPHPTIRCPKYQLESPDTLYLYRKYPHEADFNRINPKVESGTSFEDNTLIGVCNEEIGYQVINKANNSFSAQKFSQYTDANPPDKPIIRGLTVENNNLSIQWNHSLDTDVEYYKIDTMIPKYGTWITKATVSVNENVYTLVNDFCSQQSDFTVQYRILAVDLCGNSTVWDIEEKAYNPLILNTPYIHECNYVRFSWNNANCLNGDISKYFIVINNIELQTTDTIFVNNNNIITENNENVYFVKINEFQSSTTYNCQLYAVNEAQPPDTVRTCTSEFFIDKAPNSPDTLSIIGIRYNPATSSNTIDIIVDPNPDEGVEYILYTSPRTNS
ncbi:hypothetical protein LJC69_06440, partial [Bacteroidales bacterium OttesenSCG-928-K22]|nr:hypothetical protein [Bacteroidales bacterium OttesenSCG-928-K22]